MAKRTSRRVSQREIEIALQEEQEILKDVESFEEKEDDTPADVYVGPLCFED